MKNKSIFFQNNQKGFTLIELLVVVGIVSLLSSVIFASLSSARAKARDVRRISDMKAMQTAIELAKTSGIQLPSSYTYMSNALTSILVPTYIASIPTDPNPSFLYSSTTYFYCNVNNQAPSNFCHNDTDNNTYAIAFYTEKKIGPCLGGSSYCCLTSQGIFTREPGNVSGDHCTQR